MANAADWQLITTTANGISYFFDKQTVQKASDKTYFVWIKYQPKPRTGAETDDSPGSPFAYTLHKTEFNYQKKQFRELDYETYLHDNSLIEKGNVNGIWQNIDSGSAENKVFNTTYSYYKTL